MHFKCCESSSAGRLWFHSIGPCLAIRSREVSRNDDTGLASIDRRIRGQTAADHDVDQSDVQQIWSRSAIFCARRAICPVEVFGRSALSVTPDNESQTALACKGGVVRRRKEVMCWGRPQNSTRTLKIEHLLAPRARDGGGAPRRSS